VYDIVPQRLSNMVKAILLEFQFPVAESIARR